MAELVADGCVQVALASGRSLRYLMNSAGLISSTLKRGSVDRAGVGCGITTASSALRRIDLAATDDDDDDDAAAAAAAAAPDPAVLFSSAEAKCDR